MEIAPEKICTAHQRADVFTKALPRDAFRYLRSTISGWQTFARECHEHIIHDGIQKFPQIPAASVSPHVKLETKPPIQTNDSQF